ncbi:phototropic-responsive NPH3 family protein [Striga asiatica]|uniref:Phototropic-responsive NPH3 family protein n=1 Tax=Striga asiatica TaxID=4170 RepID=A0A5A7QTA2_STRAF|nr:phototropic-responsive NPH3 family protein [Striga asiatica]
MAMDEHCYLEVDVNGEEVFMVDKRIISSFSRKINKLLGKSSRSTHRTKIIFHDFPGGPPTFELVTRFFYNNGKKPDVSPLNIASLMCATRFMEINELEKLTQEIIKHWSWPELLLALKESHKLLPRDSIVLSTLVDKLLDSLVIRVEESWETNLSSHVTFSPESSGVRESCETKSSFPRIPSLFEDLTALDIGFVEKTVRIMVSRNLENGIISKFLFYYQKSKFGSSSLDSEEKVEIMEAIVDMLYSLDIKCVSHKSLFELLRVCLNIESSQKCRDTLESMIGSLLDRASLDNLLVPSPSSKSYLYDVDLVLRFLKSFVMKGVCGVESRRVKKVASLMDLYLAEIAPDPHLRPSKFLVVIKGLPDSARNSFDRVYRAMNLYFEVHMSLSEEQKIKICSGLNYEKLSTDALDHLIKNAIFPTKSASRALATRQEQAMKEGRKSESSRKIVLYARNLGFSYEREKLEAHLRGMQWRVMELEKVCRIMQFQMAKMTKSRLSNDVSRVSVPKFCS